jgi:hypothetical protein
MIEGLWKWLKSDIINNTFYPTVKEIKLSVQEFMNKISLDKSKVIERLCIKM